MEANPKHLPRSRDESVPELKEALLLRDHSRWPGVQVDRDVQGAVGEKDVRQLDQIPNTEVVDAMRMA